MMTDKLQKLAFYILAMTLFLLPFHAFGSVILNYGYGLAEVFGSPAVISMWKEFAFILLTILLGIKFFLQRKLPKIDMLDQLILGYIFFGIFHAVWLKVATAQFVWGARYDYIFLWAFMIVRHFKFNKTEVRALFKSVIIGGSLSLVFGYIIHYLVKPENLTAVGFRDDWSTWYPGQSLAFCQRIENQKLCRMSGTFAGPNQFGAYLTMFIPILYMWHKEIKARINKSSILKFIPVLLLFMSIFALYNTYSRGAFIGASIGVFTLVAFEYNLWKYIKPKQVLIGVIGSAVVGFLILSFAGDTFIRPESTGEHLSAWIMGVQEMIAHPFGQGLGSAGPASYHFTNPIIPESWYLQVGIELGFLGLALFLAILASFTKKLCEKQNMFMTASFFGVLAIAFFLHTFEDSAVSLTLFSLLGLVIVRK